MPRRPDWSLFEALVHREDQGNLPDGTAGPVDRHRWEALLQRLDEGAWVFTYTDGSPIGSPAPTLELLIEDSRSLAVWPSGEVQVNLFFRAEDRVDFDFDIGQMNRSVDLDALCSFVELVGSATSCPVDLSWEGSTNLVFMRYDPQTGSYDLLENG